MNGGPHPRLSSPPFGVSTLITRAPRSLSITVQNGPARARVRSMTSRSSRGSRALRLHEGHEAAERRLPALEPEREAPHPDLLVEEQVDVPAEVLDVKDALRKEHRVGGLVVPRPGEGLVHRHPDLLLDLRDQVA